MRILPGAFPEREWWPYPAPPGVRMVHAPFSSSMNCISNPTLEANRMFSVRQKREIADRVQELLRETGHPELPKGEIVFNLHVAGKESWSWADIQNNGAVDTPGVNPHNEGLDPKPLTRAGDQQ